MSDLRTAHHRDLHLEHEARMVPFAGYNMPVQYEGVTAEHLTVRKSVGIFDVSHMGEFRIRGPQALDLAQMLVTNDVAKLVDGKALYAVLCHESGGAEQGYSSRADPVTQTSTERRHNHVRQPVHGNR